MTIAVVVNWRTYLDFISSFPDSSSFHRIEQHAENVCGKNKGQMAFVKALEIFSNETNADRISEIVE